MDFPVLGDPWAGGRIEYRAAKVKGLPVPPASATDRTLLAKLAERAAKLAKGGDVIALASVEREIDDTVYRLFDLTAAERAQIETALANTRSASSDDDDDGDEV
jgi:hypothetical protein